MESSYRTIPLTQGQLSIVDEDIFESESQHKWFAWYSNHTNSYYVRRNVTIGKKKQTCVALHRVVAGALKGQFVDHINGDTLDNRRCNLRIVSSCQNRWNSRRKVNKIGFRGVSFYKKLNRYGANITHCRKRIHLGIFETPEEASAVVEEAMSKLRQGFDSERPSTPRTSAHA